MLSERNLTLNTTYCIVQFLSNVRKTLVYWERNRSDPLVASVSKRELDTGAQGAIWCNGEVLHHDCCQPSSICTFTGEFSFV
jgi:hypothetical protein